uniref:C2H2-type domain-containing protein n=1 Tax=Fagus sylvatica TaxID=28930 RepID=A0A2N9FWZ6_FAGSY
MPKVWCGQKSWDCKSQRQSDVFDPKTNGNLSTSNLKDVMRHTEKPLGSSRRSLGSSDSFKNPVTHEVVLDDRVCDIKIISRFCASNKGKDRGKDGPTFVYKLSPEISDHRGQHLVPNYKPSRSASIETHGGSIIFDGGCSSDISSKTRRSIETDYYCSSNLICQICGEKLKKLDAIEAHDLSNHAVFELPEGDSSSKIVEIICQKNWLQSENSCRRIEKVLKVHNMQKSITLFEEYREKVKSKASKLTNTHPRCLVDGNELLRFYGTTVEHGFFTKKEFDGGLGVFTTSTSKTAFQSIELYEETPSLRKALIVCRVVAGRVHRRLEGIQEMSSSEFDSLEGKMGCHSNIDELYVLNPRAILPCFVVIYKL